MQNDMQINNLAKLNGFTGSGEAADLLGLYSFELRYAYERSPNELLKLIMKAKEIKNGRNAST